MLLLRVSPREAHGSAEVDEYRILRGLIQCNIDHVLLHII